jgi:hypothetical protein
MAFRPKRTRRKLLAFCLSFTAGFIITKNLQPQDFLPRASDLNQNYSLKGTFKVLRDNSSGDTYSYVLLVDNREVEAQARSPLTHQTFTGAISSDGFRTIVREF